MKEENIKSPYTPKAKIIHKTLNAAEIAHKTVINFSLLLRNFKDMGEEADANTLISFSAGVMSTLKVAGFVEEDIKDIIERVQREIEEIANDKKPCDCPKCRKS